jgi:hypothetical protein
VTSTRFGTVALYEQADVVGNDSSVPRAASMTKATLAVALVPTAPRRPRNHQVASVEMHGPQPGQSYPCGPVSMLLPFALWAAGSSSCKTSQCSAISNPPFGTS